MKAILFLLSLPIFGAPVIFFTDIVSGPKTGGENNNGAYVTLYGVGFGATRGTSTVTIGGGAPAQYKTWSSGVWGGPAGTWYDKATIQLGASAATGNIVLTTSSGASNAIAFTVRSGNIYFVSNSGSDGAAGSFAAPWATGLKARDTIAAGDTVYFRAGTFLSTDDGTGWSTCMLLDANAGTSGNPKAFINYPGETVNIGSNTACPDGIRSKGTQNHYWVMAGFSIRAGEITIATINDHDWRIIGNDLSCPNGNGQSGCLDIGSNIDGTSYNFAILGNNLHNAGTNNSPGSVTALYHGFYISQQQHAMEVGWNVFAYVYGGRCIQQNVNNNSGTDNASSYDLHIHDNVIHDCQNDGIIIDTVNPSLGTVELYNNVIYNAGIGPANTENSGAWNCMNIQGWIYPGNTESGVVQVYNNTMYACGTWTSPPYNGSSGGVLWEDGNNANKSMNLRNNIIQQTTGPVSGFPYVTVYHPDTGTCSSSCAPVTGSNNMVFGNGGTPTNTVATSWTNSNPLYTNPGSAVFTLQSTSPAKNGGVTIGGLTMDIMGVPRPQNGTFSLGAFELAGGSVPSVSFGGSITVH